jgi:hypothetical protein
LDFDFMYRTGALSLRHDAVVVGRTSRHREVCVYGVRMWPLHSSARESAVAKMPAKMREPSGCTEISVPISQN